MMCPASATSLAKILSSPICAIVCDVHADHEEIARADSSGLSFAVGSMESAKLPNHIVIADLEIALLAFELHILRLPAQYGMFKNAITSANSRKSFDDSIGPDLAIWANFHVFLDDCGRMNRHFGDRFTRFSGFSG